MLGLGNACEMVRSTPCSDLATISALSKNNKTNAFCTLHKVMAV
ncbi:MAG: hypothetical protein WKG07_44410 [Hymenobacter sp.]